MQFDLDRDINAAARDVQAAINAARGQLPTNLPNNPSYRKVNPADSPIMILALTSDTYTRAQTVRCGRDDPAAAFRASAWASVKSRSAADRRRLCAST